MSPYRLSEDVARARARRTAVAVALASVSPLVVAVVAMRQLRLVKPEALLAVAAAAAVLVGVRAWLGYRRIHRHLSAFTVEVDQGELVVHTHASGTRHVPRNLVERIAEIDGELGGLRLDLAEGWDGGKGEAAYLDIPRGGDGFGDLREALSDWREIERPARRSRVLRWVIPAVVVVGLFFLPFVVDDLVRRSPLVAFGLVLVAYVAVRQAVSARG